MNSMTRFEFYSKTPENMEMLIEKAVDDALSAEGCSLNLTLPEDRIGEDGERYARTWADWLQDDI